MNSILTKLISQFRLLTKKFLLQSLVPILLQILVLDLLVCGIGAHFGLEILLLLLFL